MKGRSRHAPEVWNTIETCAFLNRALGTSTIAPWNIDAIPEHWIEMIIAAKTLEAELLNAGKS